MSMVSVEFENKVLLKMLLITTSANYQRKLSEYNKVVNEQMTAKRTLDSITEKVDDIVAAAGSESKLSKNEGYQKLVAYQSAYDTKVGNLESQALLLKNQCDSLKSAMSEGAKSNSIWCFG